MRGIDEPFVVSNVPLSMFKEVDGTIYVSGHIALDERGYFVTGSVTTQVRQILGNIRAGLEAMGSSLDEVVKTTVFLVDAKQNFDEMNTAYSEFWSAERQPSRSTIGCNLAVDLQVEIEAIAVRGSVA